MNPRLLQWLCCPACGGDLTLVTPPHRAPETDGMLRCGCGSSYEIGGGIPRFLAMECGVPTGMAPDRFLRAQRLTQKSFGTQWRYFSKMDPAFHEDLFRYMGPLDRTFFEGKLGLDAGCGFGRHAYHASQLGAEMVAVDFSQAIESASRNLRELPNVHVAQANLYRLPFRPGTFDFIYSLGVLHHLPDPELAFRILVPLLKPGGTIIIWVYSNTRRWINRALELARRVTTRLPAPVVRVISLVAGAVDYGGFVVPYTVLRSVPRIGPRVERIAWKRVKLYSRYPFHVTWADWFDRLAAPSRVYYDGPTLQQWLATTRLTNTHVSPTEAYGWRADGQAPLDHHAGP